VATERTLGVVAACGLLAAGTTALDWGRSGQRWRSSFELVDVAGRAGVLPDRAAGAAQLWYLVPALAGALLVAAGLRRPALTGGAATTLGALVGTGSFLVERSPLVPGPAVTVALVLGAATAIGGLAVLATARRTEAP